MKLVFFGTPAFALPSLRALVNRGNEVVAVVTQTDKPQGRGRRVAPPPIKELARSLGLAVFQPTQVRDTQFIQELRVLEPDAIVVVSYGRILPQALLDMPRYGGINLHPSLLPKYRGAAPIPWPILHGEEETGVTTFLMDEGMDTGPLLRQRPMAIRPFDTAGTLSERLSEEGALMLLETLDGLEKGSIFPVPQPEKGVSYTSKLRKSDGEIDWTRPVLQIHNQVRGLNPWPGAYTFYQGELLKVWTTHPLMERGAGKGGAGEVLAVGEEGIRVRTGEGELLIQELQPESRRQMRVKEYLAGHSLVPGMVLGEKRSEKGEG